jgi:cytochrome c-type protein NapB
MKLINKIGLSVAVASALFFVGCSGTQSAQKDKQAANLTDTKEAKLIDSKELSYRNVALDDESQVMTHGVKYSDNAAGSGKKFKRAFQDAPPMIPHDTEGMLPIKQGDNQCLSCHMPDVAKDVGATAIPVSHFTNFRPKSYALEGKNTSSSDVQKNVSIKKLNHLYQGRYNCSQCHAPQAQNVKLITENKFEADYTNKNGEFKSSWDDNKFMEGIDTTK